MSKNKNEMTKDTDKQPKDAYPAHPTMEDAKELRRLENLYNEAMEKLYQFRHGLANLNPVAVRIVTSRAKTEISDNAADLFLIGERTLCYALTLAADAIEEEIKMDKEEEKGAR